MNDTGHVTHVDESRHLKFPTYGSVFNHDAFMGKGQGIKTEEAFQVEESQLHSNEENTSIGHGQKY